MVLWPAVGIDVDLFGGLCGAVILWKERWERASGSEGCAWRAIDVSGCRVLRMRAVTVMSNGSEEQRGREGAEVLRVRPMVTDGLDEMD